MRKGWIVFWAAVFILTAVGAWAKKTPLPPTLYKGKPAKEAGMALIAEAQRLAGDDSWSNITIARALYLGGHKPEAQAILDGIAHGKKVKAGDWIRIGRVHFEGGDWTKAKAAFDEVLRLEPKDAGYLAEIGAYYNVKGDRAKAEELFERSFTEDSEDKYNTAKAAGSYFGVAPSW